ncbi:hypothetical protein ERO13_A02G162566v2 [Gossypium hirsutum]|uniref:Uncharacterized protein n=1 Tax=Gossypium tomentosum TaxID=34277 RepID=A0A5D2RKL7_GOSTO|nr:hypothetical protein ERO13_A02G162566v2 [Gossypium hirsutum]TYI40912.1 hypothetical protein ES332_A02G196800v1 [Gossypium tomentosum]
MDSFHSGLSFHPLFMLSLVTKLFQNQQPGIWLDDLMIGSTITIPIRCDCLTRNQNRCRS